MSFGVSPISENDNARPCDAAASGSTAARGARFVLRDRTGPQHLATEAAFAPYDLTNPAHYRSFLTAHAMALPGLEIAVTGRGWKGFHPRLPRLADDLAALGAWLPAPMIASELCDAGVWGTQYVLEGSKLGGRMMAGMLAGDVPSRYLTPDPTMGADWQQFCAALDDAASDESSEWMDEVVHSAIETFQSFRRAASALTEDLR